MLDSIIEVSRNAGYPNPEPVSRVPINRFFFVMKALAKDNLWHEVKDYLADHGYADVLVSSEPIALIQDLLKKKVSAGEFVAKRGKRFMGSISCFGGHPTPPPKPPQRPPPDGGGGDGGEPE